MHDPLLILGIGIVVVVGGIIGLRLHAFLALLFGALVVAFFTPDDLIFQFASSKGMNTEAANTLAKTKIGVRVATEFGKTCGAIGILIAMASIIGKCLLESGGAEKIVRSTLRIFGEKRAPSTFLSSSFFIGIPVFFDTVFYLMVPLAKAMAMKIGKNYLLLVLCIAAGAAMANSLVPPTPGPLFLVAEMNIPIGLMMAGGTIVGLVTIIAGYHYAKWANKRWPVALRDSVDAPLEQIKVLATRKESDLPKFWIAVLPIVIPVFFISAKALSDTFRTETGQESSTDLSNLLFQLIDFLGEKNMSLILGAIAALIMLVIYKRQNRQELYTSVQNALLSAGGIILITSAGGAFGGMLQQTGISGRISDLTQNYQMALIPLAFLITAVVRTAQGSATVAMITASGILSGIASVAPLDFHQLYLGLAIACGSKLIPWMNDSGFWIVCKMSDLTENEALKTFSPLLTIMGITGLIVTMVAAKAFPLV
jgi:gluconate:H+ symporter, GntP family